MGRDFGTVQAHLYPDSDAVFELEWIPALPDAPMLGCPSAINRLVWEHDREDWIETDVGEIFGTWRMNNRHRPNPFAIGIHRCGTDADFMGDGKFDGQPPFVEYNPDGLPTCCSADVAGLGGGVGGGSSPWSYTSPAVGGGVGGGSSPWSYTSPAVGGGVGGGSSPWSYTSPAVGGGVGGGSSPWSYTSPTSGGGVGGGSSPAGYTSPTSGGGVGGGSSPAGYGEILPTSGGGVGGGSSPAGYGEILPTSGGGVGGGESPWWYFVLEEPSGGGVGGGESPWWYFVLEEPSGGGVGGGSSPAGYGESLPTSGGGVGGGESPWSYTPPGGYCASYTVTWEGLPVILEEVGEGVWATAGWALTVDVLGYWRIDYDYDNYSWSTVAWDGHGTRTFAPIIAPGTLDVSCAD